MARPRPLTRRHAPRLPAALRLPVGTRLLTYARARQWAGISGKGLKAAMVRSAAERWPSETRNSDSDGRPVTQAASAIARVRLPVRPGRAYRRLRLIGCEPFRLGVGTARTQAANRSESELRTANRSDSESERPGPDTVGSWHEHWQTESRAVLPVQGRPSPTGGRCHS